MDSHGFLMIPMHFYCDLRIPMYFFKKARQDEATRTASTTIFLVVSQLEYLSRFQTLDTVG
jgi:hypothetical protein